MYPGQKNTQTTEGKITKNITQIKNKKQTEI